MAEPVATHGLVDSQLRCPECEYNLTGLAEEPAQPERVYRCPECGHRYHPDYLRALRANAPAPIPAWDDGEKDLVSRFVRTCLLTWFRPGRLARTLPEHVHARSVWTFATIVFLLTLLPAVMLAAARGGRLAGLLGFAAALVIPIAWLCERLIAAWLSTMVSSAPTRKLPRHASAREYWAALVGLFRSYAILESSSVCAFVACRILKSDNLAAAAFLLCFYVFPLWWYAAIAIAVAAKKHVPAAQRCVAVLTIPLIIVAVVLCAGGLLLPVLASIAATL